MSEETPIVVQEDDGVHRVLGNLKGHRRAHARPVPRAVRAEGCSTLRLYPAAAGRRCRPGCGGAPHDAARMSATAKGSSTEASAGGLSRLPDAPSQKGVDVVASVTLVSTLIL